MTLYDKFYLNDGTTLPHVGLGTVHIQGDKGIYQAHLGYRILDTATD